VNNIFKILMPLPHVSMPFMCHPQEVQISWWNMFTLRHVVPRIVRVDDEYRVSGQWKVPGCWVSCVRSVEGTWMLSIVCPVSGKYLDIEYRVSGQWKVPGCWVSCVRSVEGTWMSSIVCPVRGRYLDLEYRVSGQWKVPGCWVSCVRSVDGIYRELWAPKHVGASLIF
jgi:hypothetical protein